MEEEELEKFYEEKQSLMETKLSQERRQHSRANSHRGTEHSNRVMTYQQFREYNTERPELKTNPFFGGRDNNSTRMNNTIQSTVKSNKKVNVFRKTNSAVNIHSKKQPIRNMNKKSMNEQGFSLVKIDEVHGDQGNGEKNRKNRGQIKQIFFDNNRAG